MERPAVSLWWSGFAGGLSISFSLLGQAALARGLPQAPWTAARFRELRLFGRVSESAASWRAAAIVHRNRLDHVAFAIACRFLPPQPHAAGAHVGPRPRRQSRWNACRGALLHLHAGSRGKLASGDARRQHAHARPRLARDAGQGDFRGLSGRGPGLAHAKRGRGGVSDDRRAHLSDRDRRLSAHCRVAAWKPSCSFSPASRTSRRHVFGFIIPVLIGNVLGGTALFAVLSYAQVMKEI